MDNCRHGCSAEQFWIGTPETTDYGGIFGMRGNLASSASIYLIEEDGQGPTHIAHQYGCVCCLQFDILGRLTPIYGNIPNRLDDLMGCRCDDNIAEIDRLIQIMFPGARDIHMVDEALACFEHESKTKYLASNNCD